MATFLQYFSFVGSQVFSDGLGFAGIMFAIRTFKEIRKK